MNKILYPAQIRYLDQFRHEADELIIEMEAYAAENKIPILSASAADFLEQLIIIKNPKRVLEIGTAIAYSSIRIGRNLRKKGTLFTIEKSENNISQAKENIKKAGLTEKINILEGDALKILPRLPKKFDFIFLDADKEDYKRLFDYSMVLLKRGGIMFVDNLLWHGYAAASKVPMNYKSSTKHIREFNSIFMAQDNLKASIIPIGDGIGLGIKI